MMILLCQL
jgi:hypothetical protein